MSNENLPQYGERLDAFTGDNPAPASWLELDDRDEFAWDESKRMLHSRMACDRTPCGIPGWVALISDSDDVDTYPDRSQV